MLHTGHYENMSYRASTCGKEVKIKLVEEMKESEVAIDRITQFAKENVGQTKDKRTKVPTFAERTESDGKRTSASDTKRIEPFEETQWIIRQNAKFGRTHEETPAEWKHNLSEGWKRDY